MDVLFFFDLLSMNPDPGKGFVTLDLQGSLARDASIEVYNALGQLVLSKTYSEISGKFEIDITGQPAGVYNIRLMSGGQLVTKRIVIQ